MTLDLPHRGKLTGMGVPRGITLIVGGGYHGKSTLLKALELGVYGHVAGDGREYVVTDPTAVKVRAEDGRSVRDTDISLFIRDLPSGKDTVSFTTGDASGSTSQAAAVVEALEGGAQVLLMDEDTSATNFMVRDELMQRVVHRDMEPITPFIDRIRELYDRHGLSTILVAGSSGSYFHVADCVIQMDRYIPRDITALAKGEAAAFPPAAPPLEPGRPPRSRRCPRPDPALAGDRVKVRVQGLDGVSIDRETIDLRCVEQLCDSEQLAALGRCMLYAQRHLLDGKRTLRQVADELERLLEERGLEALCEGSAAVPFLARPRRQEILACFDRWRSLKL